jgi:hypothetical protein
VTGRLDDPSDVESNPGSLDDSSLGSVGLLDRNLPSLSPSDGFNRGGLPGGILTPENIDSGLEAEVEVIDPSDILDRVI